MNTADILAELKSLEAHVCHTANEWKHWLDGVDDRYRLSARNLLRYVALRQKDLRKLQIELGNYGLTLSQCERHVLRNLREVIARTDLTAELKEPDQSETISWSEAKHLLHTHSRAVFGLPEKLAPASEPHQAIMVTASFPLSLAECRDIIAAGATVLRINTAHDTPDEWRTMCDNWREASAASGRSTRIMTDIAGPKLRTGRVRMPSPVLKFKPLRAYDGAVLKPFRVRLENGPECQIGDDYWVIPHLSPGGKIILRDSRGRQRSFDIQEDPDELFIQGERTCYLKKDCVLKCISASGETASYRVSKIIGGESEGFLSSGDRLQLLSPQAYEQAKTALPLVECLEPNIFKELHVGQIVSFDDGRINCRVTAVSNAAAELAVEQSVKSNVRLRSDKGINTPGMTPSLPLLSPEDLIALRFALEHTDIVSFSFIRNPSDIETISKALSELTAPADFPVILKIETADAFSNLPAILLTAMRHYPVSLMIARGDLAVEVGYMRSGEVQEQILSLAEAAHIPVVLATEVLSNLLSSGSPSRAEVTDAAMSVRAECVMLNKGPFVVEAVRSLRDILLRMQLHRYKNLEIFRPTGWSHSL